MHDHPQICSKANEGLEFNFLYVVDHKRTTLIGRKETSLFFFWVFIYFSMAELVARTGRHQQRYEGGCRLVAGCIPYRYRGYSEDGDSYLEKAVEVLMINSSSGPGLLFPKGGWENDETVEEAAVREAIEEAGVRGDLMDFIGDYQFKSKTHQDECCPEGLCKAAMYALLVKEELESWPEQSTRTRSWLTIDEAVERCRHKWMEKVLKHFSVWLADKM